MVTGPFHTLEYPIGVGASRSDLAFPAMTPGSIRSYVVSLAAFCGDAGTTIAPGPTAVDAMLDPSLTGLVLVNDDTTIGMTLTGGSAAVPTPGVFLTVRLASGDVERVVVLQPIDALTPALPIGALPFGGIANDHALIVGGVQITIAGLPILI